MTEEELSKEYFEFRNNTDILKDLQDYVSLDGTEFGDTVSNLLSLFQNFPYLSDDFAMSLITELRSVHHKYKTQAKIIETKEEVLQIRTAKDLVWIDEDPDLFDS